LVARTAGIPAVDTPFLGLITDKEGLIKESKIALSLGFKGKMCIHPMHIEPINQVFSPSERDVNSAKKIIEAYEEAKARGLGAASVEGRMIDEATYKMAKETLRLYEMIIKRSI
jgi:citrate lyase beta subunit